MNPLQQLTEIFSHFPGIGPRQAKRFAYYLISRDKGYIDSLVRNLQELKRSVATCERCFRYFPIGTTIGKLCPICVSVKRDQNQIMVVSRDVDLENVEKTGTFNGLYFVLGGSIPILEKNPETRIRIKELSSRIETDGTSGALKEIILGLNLTPEGENTEQYLRLTISSATEKYSIKLSTLGRGLSTGTELEYSDPDTLRNALKNRF
ncbi:MAG: toprim domain-containing protein [Candidatus Paceibacterota bacterium]|jgi:recombination protein RecR